MVSVIQEQTAESLAEYATISCSFWVRSLLCVDWLDSGLHGIRLTEQAVSHPYLKNYDALGQSPLTWNRRWDMGNWGIFIARDAGKIVGGAVVAWRTVGLNMLEGRDDLAVLWDLRVMTEHRRQGVGRQLVNQAVSWAKARNCRVLKIETQNNNVSACRFYARCGCRLCGVHGGAYAELPDEVMLLWYLDLTTASLTTRSSTAR